MKFNGKDIKTGINFDSFAKSGGFDRPEAVNDLNQDLNDYFREVISGKMFLGTKGTPKDPVLGGEAIVDGVYDQIEMPDYGFRDIFSHVDLTKSTSESYKMIDIAKAVVFEEIKDGEPIKLRRIPKATSQLFSYLQYGTGLSVEDDYIRFNKYYELEEVLSAVPFEYLDLLATTHYALITSLSAAINIAAVASDNAATIDKMVADIKDKCKAKKYFRGENPGFIVMCNPNEERKVKLAVYPAMTPDNTSIKNAPVSNIVKVVVTSHCDAGKMYTILPGGKLKSPEWEALNAKSAYNNVQRGEDIAWRAKFQAILGDSDQVRRSDVQ